MDIRSIGNLPQPAPSVAERPAHGAEAAAPAKPAAAPVELATAVPQPGTIPNLAQLAQAVKSINKTLQEQAQGLEFTVDSDSNRTIVKVVDEQTKEVLRQIPSEEVLQIAKALDLAQQGLLIRQKA
jgi:flagellar protein FlaG